MSSHDASRTRASLHLLPLAHVVITICNTVIDSPLATAKSSDALRTAALYKLFDFDLYESKSRLTSPSSATLSATPFASIEWRRRTGNK